MVLMKKRAKKTAAAIGERNKKGKKVMKAMKGTKDGKPSLKKLAMKSMKKKATKDSNGSSSKYDRIKRRRNSKIARRSDYVRNKRWAYRLVYEGVKRATSGGLRKGDLMFNRNGKLVSRKKNKIGKSMFLKHDLDLWCESMVEARKSQGLTGFVKLKRAGTQQEKLLLTETESKWKTKRAARVAATISGTTGIWKEVNKQLKESGCTVRLADPK
eukprot:TRINITY_DN1919_c0_g1_i1.p1 TRINITY_DN1919_c0_g1~~TRINITY_DN1919_c0_g1_i1.p1  ORF type:complete len:214 (+),score=42.15 TRINITY_DN1919_c0_g1_i1:94-735(+)